MAVEGTGLSITFQSGYFAEILDWSHTGFTREAIETTNYATTGARSYQPATLANPGQLEVDFQFDPEVSYVAPMVAAAESVVVTFADAAPASTITCNGFMREVEVAANGIGERMTGRAILQLTGLPVHG